MKFVRTIKYFFLLLAKEPTRRRRFEYEDQKNLSKTKRILNFTNKLLGLSYSRLKRWQETFRVNRFNIKSRIEEYGVLSEIVNRSKEVLIVLLITILLYSIGDWLVEILASWISNYEIVQRIAQQYPSLSSPGRDFIKLFLEISIGAISAIFGIIFALYAVGIQLSTENYSAEVSDYLNSEVVNNFYFKLLVFTDLVAISVLLKTEIFHSPEPLFSFFLACLLVVISLLGVIFFKDHYIFTVKPKFLFQHLGNDIRNNIRVVSDKRKSEYHSWSVVQSTRGKTRKSLQLLEMLFDDLIHSKKKSDAIYAPIILGYALSKYVENKRYIDKNRAWWFYQTQQPTKSDNMTSVTLKRNYELRGMGPLFETKPNYLWFEEQVSNILQRIQKNVNNDNNLMTFVIQAYQTMLCKDFSNNTEKSLYQGAYENQEIDCFEKLFPEFLLLYGKLNKEEDFVDYLNAYFAVGLTLVEGFKYEEYKNVIHSFYRDKEEINRASLESSTLPTIFYNEILDYWDRIDLERAVEGRIITPVESLEKEMIDSVEQKGKEVFKKYFTQLLEHQDVLLKDLVSKKDYKNCAHLLKMRLEWVSRLFYLNKSTIAEEYAGKIFTCTFLFKALPKEIVVELEFLEEVEKVIFPAILEKKYVIFKELLAVLFLILATLNQDETNVDNIIYRNRLVVILGGFLFLQSEFEQNRSALIEYSKLLSILYTEEALPEKIEFIGKLKEVGGIDISTKLINWEIARYHNWFMSIYHKILALPKIYADVEHYSGLQEVADHPSSFITRISYGLADVEDESVEGFVDWIKKRREAQGLLKVLIAIRNEKNEQI